ncbi:LysR family transcriptional regulator [Amycolatopsis sp. NBC_00438]|uniref:LysR family transcriptional regulator n=1 Tax=Amycolatopsis sp. NBC_00438 TaxID=2903558 RepID=UPI002E215239
MTSHIHGRDVRADDLRFLAALADTGRLMTAAKLLRVDHTTVSRRLRALENALGSRLFDRGLEGWELTETGRAVVEHARTVQKAVDRAIRAVAGTEADALTGTVRVTAADGFGTRFVVPAIARVQAKHPDLNVELITGARELALRESTFDLGITLGQPPVTRLVTEKLCDYDSGFFASETYLTEHGDPVSFEELERHPLIFFVDAMQRVREVDLGRYLPNAVVRFSSTNIFAQLEATRRGVGIALLSKFMAGTAPDLRPIAAAVPLPRVPVTLAARREALTRREVRVVREALLREVHNRQDELIWHADPPAAMTADV